MPRCPRCGGIGQDPDACPHRSTYKDDFLGEWHCDDCGATLPTSSARTPCSSCGGSGEVAEEQLGMGV